MRKALLAATLTVLTAQPAAAHCPEDALEAVAMVATGGIFCQFDEARDLVNDMKNDINRIHAEGQSELNALNQRYQQETAAQQAAANAEMDAMLKRIRFLAEKPRTDFRMDAAVQAPAAASPAQAAGYIGPRNRYAGAQRAVPAIQGAPPERRAPGTTPLQGIQVSIPSCSEMGLSLQQASQAQPIFQSKREICHARSRSEELARGPFAETGAAIDAIVADLKRELDEGYETSFFAPLGAMLAGIPPPDPATLVVIWVTTQGKLVDAISEKNRVIDEVRRRNDDRLAAQARVLQALLDHVRQELARAEEIARASDAWVSAQTAENASNVEAALNLPAPSPIRGAIYANAASPSRAPARWSEQIASDRRQQRIVELRDAIMRKPLPPRPNPAELAALRSDAALGVDAIGADAAIRQANIRFADDPQVRGQVIDWIRAH